MLVVPTTNFTTAINRMVLLRRCDSNFVNLGKYAAFPKSTIFTLNRGIRFALTSFVHAKQTVTLFGFVHHLSWRWYSCL